ncbi:hypothetical protein [Aureispira anguillae]|uniref:Uncharacterized protein n=1 Tax=Aureispira anguillae TaxID=2864201 RepID=A0A915YM90_9BACT|nr:hypothetical protein [Aureispira anguillae]BDS15393.1 hypothetical protein AsAng_0061770 [Aureispira anguillae]
MTNIDIVHQLIHSMSRTEKAYFKKYARKQQREKDDFYFKLFDAIDKQVVYDSNRLIKKFKSQKLTVKQLSISKHYLYNLIVSNLLEYNQNKSIQAQLHQQIETIQLLHKRSLSSQALKTLYKAQKLAQKHEFFLYILLLKNLEEEILRIQMSPDLTQYLNQGFKEEQRINQQWLNLRHYRYLATKFTFWNKQQYSSRTEDSDLITENFLEEVKQVAPPLSIKAKFLHLHCLLDYYTQKSNFHKAREVLQQQVVLFEENPAFLEQRSLTYITILNNLGVNQRLTNDLESMLDTAAKLKAFKCKTIHEEIQIFESWAQTMLIYITYSKPAPQHLSELILIEEQFKILENKIGNEFKIIIPYGLACCYFWRKRYQQALDWLELVQNRCTKQLMPDLKIAARLIKLIIHYELDHQYYLLNANESTYRYLSYNQRLYKVEATLLKTLRQLAALASPQQASSIFKAFKEKLLLLQEDPFEMGALQLFDFIQWADQKINRPITSTI